MLAVWGARDPWFVPAGAHAFRRDVPDARVELVDGGHFAMEEELDVIVALVEQCLVEPGRSRRRNGGAPSPVRVRENGEGGQS